MKTLIGAVPDDWHQITVGTACEVSAGPSGAMLTWIAKSHQVEANPIGLERTIPMVAPKGLRGGRIEVAKLNAIREDLVNQRLSTYRLEVGDIVCVRTGTLGRCALVRDEHRGWLYGTGCLRLRIAPESRRFLLSEYLSYYLDHPLVRDWLQRHATTTTVPSLSAESMMALPLVVPPTDVQRNVCEILGALDAKIVLHEKISQTATKLRDTLLPGLLGDVIASGTN